MVSNALNKGIIINYRFFCQIVNARLFSAKRINFLIYQLLKLVGIIKINN